MRYLSLLILVCCAISSFSCADSEEPRSPLIGTWENRNYSDSLEVWFVESYTFRNDSLFDVTASVRKTEIGEELGYRLTATSWYNFEAGIFQYYYSDAMIHFGGENQPFYAPKQDLKPGIVDFFRVPKGKLTFSSDLRQFTFQEDCWSVNEENDCIEFPAKTFVRVD
ncbi:hypothetical protein PBT90_15810 [Algoriphagus halophytocola]|uniref:Lipocalin-like domain-containing protein n=1 Tax=Algoriphagus halophytocola TaxID=2991499 RepID=A0ABY6MF26_9BACT|nr:MULTISPECIES: hypothetical protein [unclassified Algoriphagus]UZD21037.1 hypothetical protein OM944_10145 [Algoriphagus sp. TR-M5]WBL42203.1 hypothetical protein PBT90_15810 [Algoriphagus sp. TR-M9]